MSTTREIRAKMKKQSEAMWCYEYAAYLRSHNYIVFRMKDFDKMILTMIKSYSYLVLSEGEDYIYITSDNEYYNATIRDDGFRFVIEERVGHDQVFPEIITFEYHDLKEMFDFLIEHSYIKILY